MARRTCELAGFCSFFFTFYPQFPNCGRNDPVIANSFRRTIHKFDSANSVITCAVFFAKPRNRTFTRPNWRLITRNGCSTLARMLALWQSS